MFGFFLVWRGNKDGGSLEFRDEVGTADESFLAFLLVVMLPHFELMLAIREGRFFIIADCFLGIDAMLML